ncbi:MAG: hypothetical protein OHK0029_09400 [Armatimonadaceae bacterium]
MEMSNDKPRIVLAADDLMFPSRVREGLRPLDYTLQVCATAEAMHTALHTEPLPAAVLVNLTARRYDPADLIRQIKGNARTQAIPVMAFAGHVEREKHALARDAGADLVAANSSVALHLPALLARLLNRSNPTEERDTSEGVIEIEEG